MELDFDKYCVVDTSPNTVLLAPRSRSKASNRKSSGKPKYGNDMLCLKENFSERIHRYRSASCRDVSSNMLRHKDNEVLKRGSVYQSSKDLRFLAKTDSIEGRQKIEFSRGIVPTLPFGIIDSLCSSEDDGSITEQNRSSILSLTEQKLQIKLCSLESEHFSLPHITRSIPPRVAFTGSSDRESLSAVNEDNPLIEHKVTKCERVVYPFNNGNNSQERHIDVNLHKSFAAKLALPDSPVQSTTGSSNSPNGRLIPINMPFVKSKFQKSPLSSAKNSHDGVENKQTVDSGGFIHLSDKKNHKEYISLLEKEECRDSVLQVSPAHLHGLLRLENKQGVPFIKFFMNSSQDIYVAETKKIENAWVYTLYTVQGKRKSSVSAWGMKESNRQSSIVGQVRVSCYIHAEVKGAGALNESMVTEFVLYDLTSLRRSISSRDSFIHALDVKGNKVSDEILAWGDCKLHEFSAKSSSADSCDSRALYESSASRLLGPAYLHPELEIAAVVIEIPFNKRESLKFKSVDKISENTFSSFVESGFCERQKVHNSDASSLGKMHVVIPFGNHSLPRTESQGPSPLLDRWRLGGGCDCGGWDMGCPIDVFDNENIQIAEGILTNQRPLELFVQGRKDEIPSFTMTAIEDGKYDVYFHARLSSLQAFAISVAILHTSEASASVEGKQSRQFLQCNSLKVFPEEEKSALNKKMEESLPSFVLNPPFSPIARV